MGGTGDSGVVHSRPEADDEREILAAMLLSVGDLGFADASVQDAIERAGCSRSHFYRHFKNKEECYARAYEVEAELLCQDMLEAARAEANWPTAFRASLARLLRFVTDQPALTRALLIEVHAARGPALVKFEEIVKRLTHAVDSARQEETQHSPPPLTARFILAAVQYSIGEWLIGERKEGAMCLLPGLAHFAVMYYFGESAARAALEET